MTRILLLLATFPSCLFADGTNRVVHLNLPTDIFWNAQIQNLGYNDSTVHFTKIYARWNQQGELGNNITCYLIINDYPLIRTRWTPFKEVDQLHHSSVTVLKPLYPIQGWAMLKSATTNYTETGAALMIKYEYLWLTNPPAIYQPTNKPSATQTNANK